MQNTRGKSIMLPDKIKSNYKYLETVNLKEFGIRKKIEIFVAKDLGDQISIIFHISQKSRFLQKDADKIEEISDIVTKNIKYTITSKIILIESPLCSKAKAKLEELQWNVII